MELIHLEGTGGSSQKNEGLQQPEQLPSGMPNSGNGQKKRKRDWQDEETSILLECLKLPQFRNQERKRIITKWDAIAEDIQSRLGPDPAMTGKRCMQRWGTLMGFHRKINSTWEHMKKGKDNLAKDEWGNLRDSTGLTEDWYQAIGEVTTGPRQGKRRSRMHCNFVQNVNPDGSSSSCVPTVDGLSEPVQTKSPDAGRSAKKQIDFRRLNSLNDSRRTTLLDLIFRGDSIDENWGVDFNWDCEILSNICRWVSIVQKRECLEVYDDVIALEKMGLVSTSFRSACESDRTEGYDDIRHVDSEPRLIYSRLRVYEKFYKKEMLKNPDYDTRLMMRHESMVTIDSTFAPEGITVLNLQHCDELEVVNWRHFPKLRCLSIRQCPKLREMTGWDYLDELGWLDVYGCPSYKSYPPSHKIPSLQKCFLLRLDDHDRCPCVLLRELDLSGCVRLRTLDICFDRALSSIRGLDELRSLTVLKLWCCDALVNLPDIGHMKDLTELDISYTGVAEIKGVEKLSSLRKLWCCKTQLKTLPDLSHLPQLQFVHLDECPVVKDPSSPYFGRGTVYFNVEKKLVDVSDISDNERDLSDEEM